MLNTLLRVVGGLALCALSTACGAEASVTLFEDACISVKAASFHSEATTQSGDVEFEATGVQACPQPDAGPDCPSIVQMKITAFNDTDPPDDVPQPQEIVSSSDSGTVSPAGCAEIGTMKASFGSTGMTNRRYELIVERSEGKPYRETGTL